MGDGFRENLDSNNEMKSFYKKLLYIGIPVILQNLINLGLNMVDVIMIGNLGEKELAGVGSANQVFFVFGMLCFGFYSGASSHMAQNWGINNIQKVKKILQIEYVYALVGGIAILGVILLFPESFLRLFAQDSFVIEKGSEYIKIVAFTYPLTALSYAIIFNSRIIQRLKFVVLINVSAIALNTFLNYILIYGKFGFDAQGVYGAGLATFISRSIEFILIFGYIYLSKNHPFNIKYSKMNLPDMKLIKEVVKTSTPVVFTEGGWGIATAAVFAIYGLYGSSALAVVKVAEIISDFSQVMYFGLGNSALVIIGEALGKNQKEKAWIYAKKTLIITWILNVLVTVILIFLSDSIAGIYEFQAETTEMLAKVIVAWAFTTTPKMLAYILIVGILRAGGDTLYALILELSCNIVLQVGMAMLSVVVFEFSLPVTVLVVASSDLVKTIFGYHRLYSRKWMKVLV